MTNADVMVQILSEASGKPKSEFAAMLACFPPEKRGQLDKELTDDEAKRLIESLRQEQSGILAWMVKGAKS